MKHVLSLPKLILAGSLALGLTAFAANDYTATSPSNFNDGALLGQNYANLSYAYVDIAHTDVDADAFSFEYNSAIKPGLDSLFNYTYLQSEKVFGERYKQHDLNVAFRAFAPAGRWGAFKPYVEGGVGWEWQKFAGFQDDSFAWHAAVGAEFVFAPAFSITPFVQYSDAVNINNSNVWTYGAKANFWVNDRWALAGTVLRDDDQNTSYRVGVNWRF